MRNLEDDMKLVIPFIEDKRVTDIAIGTGGELIVEGMGMGKRFTGIYFDAATTTRIIYASAAVLGVAIDPENPIVEGVLPNWKIRIEGILPPRATENPMLFIRRPPAEIFTLESYAERGRMTREQFYLLVHHIQIRSNIIIGGETGSGKTTLLNAIIDKMRELTPNDRFYIAADAGYLVFVLYRAHCAHEVVYAALGAAHLEAAERVHILKEQRVRRGGRHLHLVELVPGRLQRFEDCLRCLDVVAVVLRGRNDSAGMGVLRGEVHVPWAEYAAPVCRHCQQRVAGVPAEVAHMRAAPAFCVLKDGREYPLMRHLCRKALDAALVYRRYVLCCGRPSAEDCLRHPLDVCLC